MKECIVIRPFTDKYDNEIHYVKGQKILVDEERMKEMNFKKDRVLEIIDVETTETNVETEEEVETTEANVETEEVAEDTETNVETEEKTKKTTRKSSKKKETEE